MRLTKFRIGQLRAHPLYPRPANYLDLLRPCAVQITPQWWSFDRSSPCYKKLLDRFKAWVPAPEDWERFERQKAERKAKLDKHTRHLWGELHKFTLRPEARDPVELAIFVKEFEDLIPCGDCKVHWMKIKEQFPPDANDPFTWGVNVHNAVNRLPELKKKQWTVEEARAVWATRPPS